MSIKDDNIPLADDDPQGNIDLAITCFQSKFNVGILFEFV